MRNAIISLDLTGLLIGLHCHSKQPFETIEMKPLEVYSSCDKGLCNYSINSK